MLKNAITGENRKSPLESLPAEKSYPHQQKNSFVYNARFLQKIFMQHYVLTYVVKRGIIKTEKQKGEKDHEILLFDHTLGAFIVPEIFSLSGLCRSK